MKPVADNQWREHDSTDEEPVGWNGKPEEFGKHFPCRDCPVKIKERKIQRMPLMDEPNAGSDSRTQDIFNRRCGKKRSEER